MEMTITGFYKPDTRTHYRLPYFSGGISAGLPASVDETICDGRIDLNKHLIRNPLSTFFAPVIGDSMLPTLSAGETLVVDRSVEISHGRIVVVYRDAEFMVKRAEFRGKHLWLVPDNPDYEAFKWNDEYEIWGVVTGKYLTF